MYEDIDLDKVKAEFLTTLTRVRWDKMGKEPEDIQRWRETSEIEEEKKIEMIADPDRREVDLTKKEVNVGHRR